MATVFSAREASRSVLLKCCTVDAPTNWHRKVVRCLTRIDSSLDRVEKYGPFLLTVTATAVDALNATLDWMSRWTSLRQPCSQEEEAEMSQILSKLWGLYSDLDDGLKLQEVTTPGPKMLPKLKCSKSEDSPRVKSPLARVSLTRSQSMDS